MKLNSSTTFFPLHQSTWSPSRSKSSWLMRIWLRLTWKKTHHPRARLESLDSFSLKSYSRPHKTNIWKMMFGRQQVSVTPLKSSENSHFRMKNAGWKMKLSFSVSKWSLFSGDTHEFWGWGAVLVMWEYQWNILDISPFPQWIHHSNNFFFGFANQPQTTPNYSLTCLPKIARISNVRILHSKLRRNGGETGDIYKVPSNFHPFPSNFLSKEVVPTFDLWFSTKTSWMVRKASVKSSEVCFW